MSSHALQNDENVNRSTAAEIAKVIDDVMLKVILGPQRYQPKTALRAMSYWPGFEVVELDDAGKVIEKCRRCGPVLLCADCMSRVT